MSIDQRRLLVRALRGTQAQILLAFLFAGQALDVAEIHQWTGLHNQTIREDLKALTAIGLLAPQVLAHNRHVWLPGADLLPLQFATFSRTGDDSVVVGALPLESLPLQQQQQSQFATFSRTGNPEILEALRAVNIVGKKAEEVAACAWVTPEYIRAAMDDSSTADNPQGMAISKMLAHAEFDLRSGEEKHRDRIRESMERFFGPDYDPDEDEPT